MWPLEAGSVGSLSHRERGGVRGVGPSIGLEPPHPNPLPKWERELTELAALPSIRTANIADQSRSLATGMMIAPWRDSEWSSR
jgi:hypothetical protein